MSINALLMFLSIFSNANAGEPANPKYCWELPGLESISTPNNDNGITIYYYSDHKQEAQEILRMVTKADLEVQGYFGVQRKGPYRVYLAKDRDTFAKISSRYDINWKEAPKLTGTAVTINDMILLGRSVWTKEALDFIRPDELIKHEMIHNVMLQIQAQQTEEKCVLKPKPSANAPQIEEEIEYWFDEGFATFVSGQLATWKNRIKYDLDKCPHFAQTVDCGGYTLAATAVEYLVKTFGKDKVLEAIHKMPWERDPGYSIELSDKVLFDTLGQSSTSLEKGWHEYVLKNYPQAPKTK